MTNNAFARPASKFGRPRSGPVPVAQSRAAALPTDSRDDTNAPTQDGSSVVEEELAAQTSTGPENSASVDSAPEAVVPVDVATPELGPKPEPGTPEPVNPDPIPESVSTNEPDPIAESVSANETGPKPEPVTTEPVTTEPVTTEPVTPEPVTPEPTHPPEDSQQVKPGTKRTSRTSNRGRKDTDQPHVIPLVVISEGIAATSDEVHILDLDKTNDLDDVGLLEVVRGLRPVADSDLKTKTVRTLMAMIEQKALADN